MRLHLRLRDVILGMVTMGTMVAPSGSALAETEEEAIVRRLYEEKCTPSSSLKVTRLGDLIESDDVEKQRFAIVVCQRADLDLGTWDLRIQSNRATGAGLTNAEARAKAQDAEKAGKKSFTIGIPFNPRGPEDHRRIEYRIHQAQGTPTSIELTVIMRDEKRNAKRPRVLKIPWPS